MSDHQHESNPRFSGNRFMNSSSLPKLPLPSTRSQGNFTVSLTPGLDLQKESVRFKCKGLATPSLQSQTKVPASVQPAIELKLLKDLTLLHFSLASASLPSFHFYEIGTGLSDMFAQFKFLGMGSSHTYLSIVLIVAVPFASKPFLIACTLPHLLTYQQ